MQDVIDGVVLDLESDNRSRMSGDSGLRNVWEEVCVQMQGERSYHWSLYEQHIYSLGLGYIETWSEDKVFAIHGENFKRVSSDVKRAKTELALRVFSKVKIAAKKFKNERIREYLRCQSYDDD